MSRRNPGFLILVATLLILLSGCAPLPSSTATPAAGSSTFDSPPASETPASTPALTEGAGQASDPLAACPASTATVQILVNVEGRYCLAYPAEYKVEKPNPEEVDLTIRGLLDHVNPRAHIRVTDAGSTTADSAADAIVSDFQGFILDRSTMTIAGEPAVMLDKVPGQDLNRRVFLVHDGLLYEFFFTPADPALGETYEKLGALQQQVLDSFVFLPEGVAPVSDCLTPTDETQLFEDAKLGFCLLYPAGFTAEAPSENSALFYSGSLQSVDTPRLYIEIEDAGDRTAQALADAAVAEIGTATPGLQIDRTFGVTLGYEPAERLDGMPGQDLNRQLIVVKDGRAYRLTFLPADPGQADAYQRMEALYDLVVKSFRFLE